MRQPDDGCIRKLKHMVQEKKADEIFTVNNNRLNVMMMMKNNAFVRKNAKRQRAAVHEFFPHTHYEQL